MKTSYSNKAKSSIKNIKEFNDLNRVEFIKRTDVDTSVLVGATVEGILYLTKKGKMKSDSSSLAIIGTDGRAYLLTIPSWLGKRIVEDFQDSDQTAEEFFNVKISGFRDITTKDGNSTFDVDFETV